MYANTDDSFSFKDDILITNTFGLPKAMLMDLLIHIKCSLNLTII